MVFTWTVPDPLDKEAITRSIYITELQDATNIRRAEITKSPISFIDQAVGKIFTLAAVEELKTAINQLAIDFGYSGVSDINLLGSDWVTITKKYDKPVCHFPILNDMRLVLNRLSPVPLLFLNSIAEVNIFDLNLINTKVTSGPVTIGLQTDTIAETFSIDNNFVYSFEPLGGGSNGMNLHKRNIVNTDNILEKNFPFYNTRDIVADDNFIYILYLDTRYITGPGGIGAWYWADGGPSSDEAMAKYGVDFGVDNDYYYDTTTQIYYQKISGVWIAQAQYSITYRIGKIDKLTFSFSSVKLLPQLYVSSPSGPPTAQYSYAHLVCDDSQFFVLGSHSAIDRDFVMRVDKIGSTFLLAKLEQNIVGAPTSSNIDDTHAAAIATNGNGNIYLTYWETWVGPGGALGTLNIASAILRLGSNLVVNAVISSSQDSFVLTGVPTLRIFKHLYSCITISNDFVYVFCHYNHTEVYELPYPTLQAEYTIFDITNNAVLTNANNIESQLIRTGVAVDWVDADNVESYYGRFVRPDTPVLYTAIPSSNQVILNWSFVLGATGYKIKYGTSSKNYTESIVVGNLATYTVSNLSTGIPYYFVVVALDNTTGGQSFNSNELSVVPG